MQVSESAASYYSLASAEMYARVGGCSERRSGKSAGKLTRHLTDIAGFMLVHVLLNWM